jgi:hypothetical protein
MQLTDDFGSHCRVLRSAAGHRDNFAGQELVTRRAFFL